MPHSNRTFAIAYVFLVALPITGLVGVLRSGRDLKAPISVDGGWKFRTGASRGDLSPCLSLLGLDADTPITISQSGRYLAIGGAKAGGTGVIEGSALHAVLRPAAGGAPLANCGSEGSVALAATVDPKSNPPAMSGVLSVDACPSCGSVQFEAARQASAQKKGGQ